MSSPNTLKIIFFISSCGRGLQQEQRKHDMLSQWTDKKTKKTYPYKNQQHSPCDDFFMSTLRDTHSQLFLMN